MKAFLSKLIHWQNFCELVLFIVSYGDIIKVVRYTHVHTESVHYSLPG